MVIEPTFLVVFIWALQMAFVVLLVLHVPISKVLALNPKLQLFFLKQNNLMISYVSPTFLGLRRVIKKKSIEYYLVLSFSL